jgi:hypothetical protein
MQAATVVKNDLRAAADQTLRYFALFRYPLNAAELHVYCGSPCSLEEMYVCLDVMSIDGSVYEQDGYYSNSPEISSWLPRRLRGNEKAGMEMHSAQKIARLIYQFPFVAFVGISGSLSKGYSDERTDFDFFIVTSSNRLWISRTFLHAFKKFTFLFRQQHKFCMNYFLDTQHLQLEEKNLYTATELSSLIPVCGANVYDDLMRENAWIHTHLPNHPTKSADELNDRRSALAATFDWLLNFLFPSTLNRSLMKMTDAKWRRKWARKGYPAEDYELAFKTRLYVSKNHPANYQKKILKALNSNPA